MPTPRKIRMVSIFAARGSSLARRYCLPAFGVASLVGILSCREDVTSPSGPEPDAAAASVAQAPNSWIARAPIGDNHNFSSAAAANAAGQWFAYTFGGRDDDRGVSRHTLRYNVQANTWSSQDINSLVESFDMNGVGRIGNKFYMTGGWASCCSIDIGMWNALWVYDIGANTQTRKADMPRATRSGQTAVINDKLYVSAGYCSGFSFDPGHCITESPVKQFYRYDPATNTWIFRRYPPHFHTYGAGAVINGKFYLVGDGHPNTGSARELDVYDPVSNTWTSKAPIPSGGNRFSAAVIQNRMFVIVSNQSGSDDMIKAYSYDPATNSWRSRAAPPVFQQIVRVQLDGQARLFLPGNPSSYLYAP